MYKIRLATLADVDNLVSLRLVFLEEVGSIHSGVDSGELGKAIEDYLLRKIPTGEFLAWIAESDGRIVGTSGLTLFERPPNGSNIAGHEAYLSNMYTLPDWRGKGVGTALITAIIDHVKATSARRIWLHATDQGKPVYDKAGFVMSKTDMELAW